MGREPEDSLDIVTALSNQLPLIIALQKQLINFINTKNCMNWEERQRVTIQFLHYMNRLAYQNSYQEWIGFTRTDIVVYKLYRHFHIILIINIEIYYYIHRSIIMYSYIHCMQFSRIPLYLLLLLIFSPFPNRFAMISTILHPLLHNNYLFLTLQWYHFNLHVICCIIVCVKYIRKYYIEGDKPGFRVVLDISWSFNFIFGEKNQY